MAAKGHILFSMVCSGHHGQDLDHDFIRVFDEEGRLYIPDIYEDFVFIEVAHDVVY